MFVEVLLVIDGQQIQSFYGPFITEEERDHFKECLAETDRLVYEVMGEVHNPAHIKYISCDSMPEGDWGSVPANNWPGVFYWYKKEDAGDWRPHTCHEE